MTSNRECTTPLLQTIDQDLLLEEVEKEGSYQTKLTESECSGLSNPPIVSTITDGRQGTLDSGDNNLKPLSLNSNKYRGHLYLSLL